VNFDADEAASLTYEEFATNCVLVVHRSEVVARNSLYAEADGNLFRD
jgi:hypothetical protein